MQGSQGYTISATTAGPGEMRFGQPIARWGTKKGDRSVRTGPPSAGRSIKRERPIFSRSLKASAQDHPRYEEWRANKRAHR